MPDLLPHMKFHPSEMLARMCWLTTLALLAAGAIACGQPSMVSFKHLEHLTETITLSGQQVDIVHVYANYPDYRWFEAADAGTEGIACVDDAARAAVVYLRHFELTGDRRSLGHAKSLLKFVLGMQAPDGQFCNFVYRDHSINTTGRTSLKSFGWWAARGVWSLGLGYRLFEKTDPSFAGTLKKALERSRPHITALLDRYGKCDTVSGLRVPRWLPYGSGADVTSELLLGLVEFCAAEPDSSLRTAIRELGDGILMMQDGGFAEYPYGLHRSWETQWHMWGNSQTQVLAAAGRVLGDSVMLASAEREATGFYSRLLTDGFFKEFDVAGKTSRARYEQIAYAVRPMAVGLVRLYEATGKRLYLVMAGLAASWLFGNNVLRQQIYDPSTGRCFDGIRDSLTINRNAGAESTIEALYSVLEVEQYPDARKYLRFTRVSARTTDRYHTARFQGPHGEDLTFGIDLRDGAILIMEDEASRKFQEQSE